jgi:hypothetical protein
MVVENGSAAVAVFGTFLSGRVGKSAADGGFIIVTGDECPRGPRNVLRE